MEQPNLGQVLTKYRNGDLLSNLELIYAVTTIDKLEQNGLNELATASDCYTLFLASLRCARSAFLTFGQQRGIW